MEKTICLMTNWYPAADNPYRGVFFKEQAFAVADSFHFLVVHYQEVIRLLPGKTTVQKIHQEKNTEEYSVTVPVPMWLAVCDVLHNLFVKLRGSGLIDGVGKYISKASKNKTRRSIRKVFSRREFQKIDAFYCVDAQTEAFQIRCAAETLGKPYVIGEHAPVPWPGTQINDINREAMEKADLYLAISHDKIRQMMLQNIRLPKTVYIGNLIDETALTIGDREKTHVPTLLIVAAHSFYKNYDLFVQVMNRLTEITAAAFKVLIVGYASNKGYSKGTEAFEEQIRRSAFADRAEMIREVAHENIGEIYHRADAFVMTSVQEGQPVSAMEAACCGLPVYSTRCGGVEDYVDATTGRIYAVDDGEGMAQGLKDFVEGKTVYDAQKIRENVVRRFGKQAFTKCFTDAFLGVMKDA